MHFQQTRLADLLCSDERSSESTVLKLTILYCRGHIKRKNPARSLKLRLRAVGYNSFR